MLLQLDAIRGRRPILRKGHTARYTAGLYLLMAPYLAGTLVLVLVPAVLMFGLAFTTFDGLAPPQWSGLGTFREVLVRDPLVHVAALNSLYFVALAVPLRVLSALLLALLLNRPRRGVAVYRVAVYLPTIIPDVAYALIWLWIFNPLYGPLNTLLGMLGWPEPVWLADARTAKLAIVVMSAFQIGEGFAVLLAGLQDVPRDLYDATVVDGGNRRQMLRYITLPLLAPWLLLLTLRDIIMSAQTTFTPAYIMTGGDPYYATLFFPLLIYQRAFDRFRFGEGAAMMLLLFVAVGALLLLVYYLVRIWGYESEH